jgi:hypothetical protein
MAAGQAPPRPLPVPEGGTPTMSEWVSLAAAGKRLGVSGGDIRRAGYAKVTAARLDAWEHEPPVWLGKARERKRRSADKAECRPGTHLVEVSCCACGTVRQVRPGLVSGYTHLVCGPCGKAARRPDVPSRPGMVLVHEFSVAGFFDGYTYRIATAEERASIARAAALARAVFPDLPGGPGSDA